MPLLAYTHSGELLVAPLLSDHVWENLRSTRNRDVWMPHGKGRAIPKVSRLGTRFFAHPPGQTSAGAKESDLHLSIKAQSLLGARAAGWEALPEQSGTTPDGRDWRADVLCRRPGKAWTVAVEAQVQLQGEEAYRQRQERYAASGIRALWLVAHEPAALHHYWREPDSYLPAFKTTVGNNQHSRPEAQVQIDGLSLSIPEFVSGALSGQLHWSGNGRHGILMLVLRKDQCWHRTCRKTVLLAYRAETPRRMPLDLEAVQTMHGYGDAYARARAVLPELADSPWRFRKVLASRCPYCRREIRYHSHDWEGQDVLDVPIGVDVGEQGRHLGLTPHAQWHWGPQTRWTRWAPLGGVGLISPRRLAMHPRRFGPRTG
jgi:hypothetical protein